MKKRLAVILGGWVVWVFLMTIPVLADAGVHRRYTGASAPSTSCAGCHRAHTAVAPGLLKDEQPALCYACHGETGQGTELNVEGGVEFAATYTPGDLTAANGTFSALRGGGFKYAAIDGNTLYPGQSIPAAGAKSDPKDLVNIAKGSIHVLTTRALTTSAHSVDPNADVTMWGNGVFSSTANAGPTVQLTCSSCHDPHGNGNYRILRGIPDGAGATVTAVNIADPATKTYTTSNYWDVSYTEATDVASKISTWCSTCHTRYLADSYASKPNVSGGSPSGDAIFAYRHMTNSTVAYSPTCIQCHVAHGSNAAMSGSSATVALPGSSTVPTETSRLLRTKSRGVCQMCHLR